VRTVRAIAGGWLNVSVIAVAAAVDACDHNLHGANQTLPTPSSLEVYPPLSLAAHGLSHPYYVLADGCHKSCAVGCQSIAFSNGVVVPRSHPLACATQQLGKHKFLNARRCKAGFKPVPWLRFGCYRAGKRIVLL
jgi:hypothetical protein